jgi:hypothetical protein
MTDIVSDDNCQGETEVEKGYKEETSRRHNLTLSLNCLKFNEDQWRVAESSLLRISL